MNFREIEQWDIETIADYRMNFLYEVTDEELPRELRPNIIEYLKKHLADGTCIGVVAEEQNTIIAKAILCIYEIIPDERNLTGLAARVYSVYTLPEYRGKGIMKELLQCLIIKAKESGVNEIYLTAEEKAIPLYKRLGFEVQDQEMRFSFV